MTSTAAGAAKGGRGAVVQFSQDRPRGGVADSVLMPQNEPSHLGTPFPVEGMEVTHLLVVSDLERSRDFYQKVLGAELYREYGGSSVVLRFLGTWLLLVTAGGPTADKPDVTFAAPASRQVVSHEMTIRVPDCRAAYETLRSRGAEFLTPPFDYEWEVRCFFRDPDGHLLEISEAKSSG